MPKHSETRHIPYTAQQMYDLVSDVSSYPEFIPWTSGAKIRSLDEQDNKTIMIADLIVSFKLFEESFGSEVVLRPGEKKIDTSYLDGPFKHMISQWAFTDTDNGCDVHFKVDFEFKSLILQKTATVFFNMAMQKVVHSFEKRANELYAQG